MECIILSSHLTSEKWEAPPFGLVWKINWKMVKKQEKKLNFVRFDLIIIENSYLCQTPSQLDNLEVFHGKLMNWRIIISHHLSAGLLTTTKKPLLTWRDPFETRSARFSGYCELRHHQTLLSRLLQRQI